MPSTPRKTSKNRVHLRVAAATLAAFSLALGVVTFAGAPLPQTTTAASGTTASTSSSTSQPVSGPASGQTSSATLTTSTS
jgi:hypothetical protein